MAIAVGITTPCYDMLDEYEVYFSMIKIYYGDSDSPIPNRPRVPSVHGLLVNPSGEILLHRREDSDLWAIPGGKINPDESVGQCLRREMSEELGVEVADQRLLGIYTDPSYMLAVDDDVQRVFLVVFRCVIKTGTPTVTDETVEFRWFSRDNLRSVDAFPMVKEIADQVFDDIQEAYFD